MAILTIALVSMGFLASDPSSSVGKTISNFSLPDHQGSVRSLEGTAEGSKVVVVAFVGTECPLSQRYEPVLAKLANLLEPKGVTFIGVYSNSQDSIAEIAADAKKHSLTFPLLKDAGSKIADQFGATRTPEVFVLDRARKIRYQGAIDDQFGVDSARPKAKRSSLLEAVDELLLGKEVATPFVPAKGCLIGRVRVKADSNASVTYSSHVASIIQKHCLTCHRTGEVGPFDLSTYESASDWSESMLEAVDQGLMPPWDASPKFGKFSNESRLSDEERRILREWVEAGAPEGDLSQAPPAPKFVQGWRIGEPDLVVTLPKPVKIPASGTVNYQYFSVDPGLKKDVWVRASEARAGNPKVVHHILAFVQPPDENRKRPSQELGSDWIAVDVPGGSPWVAPEGLARFVPAGSRFVFQMHYTPDGEEETDQSKLGLVFAEPSTIKKELKSAVAFNRTISIGPGEANASDTTGYRFQQDMFLYSLVPHMHLRGKAFRVDAENLDGTTETLLDVPRYRFNWQNLYRIQTPRFMAEKTSLVCTGWFDNSRDNPSNPDSSG